MARQFFDWLNQSQPPAGLTTYEYPESGDVRSPVDADPDIVTPDISPRQSKPAAAGYDDQGRMTLPGEDMPTYQPPVQPNVIGNESAFDSWDYTSEMVPVYAVPPEMGGGEYVGDLRWAPSLPQNLQPIRYVKVPRMERLT